MGGERVGGKGVWWEGGECVRRKCGEGVWDVAGEECKRRWSDGLGSEWSWLGLTDAELGLLNLA